MSPALSLREVRAGYGDKLVLAGVSLEAPAGRVTALVGPNGAGKSTLLRAIAGLLPIAGGEIVLDERRIDGRPAWAIAADGLVLVPEGRRLFAPLSVRENLELGAFLPRARAARDETREAVFRLFPTLAEKQHVPAGALSGGEQQMLALARGLMARPRLLCLDDPFLGLAAPVIARVAEALRAEAAAGVTILAAGQHVRRLLRLADHACLLDAGRVVLAGTGDELFGDERVRRALLPAG
jgi:branched-chain amino acid transport system ATP-binding protein